MRIGAYNLEAREIAGETLDGKNPFKLLNDHILEEHGMIGEYTLVIGAKVKPTPMPAIPEGMIVKSVPGGRYASATICRSGDVPGPA